MSLRILYVGNDLALYYYLQDSLDMKVVHCFGISDAKLLIAGIEYSAVVLDKSAKELERFTRALVIHKKTPVVIVSGLPENVAEAIKNSLNK